MGTYMVTKTSILNGESNNIILTWLLYVYFGKLQSYWDLKWIYVVFGIVSFMPIFIQIKDTWKLKTSFKEKLVIKR